ncbi:hypothetical protein WH47_10834 [Habropoda laboriosa]|uniref:Uncharacterized protein n=1 Tax=Habropoda laboriosa TaxID=597456 RepID=A0A0L7RDN9_9HYME|nr:hypothetical protein WH47_10834 [Habropoda laboriosa]
MTVPECLESLNIDPLVMASVTVTRRGALLQNTAKVNRESSNAELISDTTCRLINLEIVSNLDAS